MCDSSLTRLESSVCVVLLGDPVCHLYCPPALVVCVLVIAPDKGLLTLACPYNRPTERGVKGSKVKEV
jgi:hypothetical protein